MFVRNNIVCPNCGKTTLRDLQIGADSFDGFILLVAECYECLGLTSALLDLSAAISLILKVTQSLPRNDRRRRCWNWRTSYCWWKHQQRAAILSLYDDVFETGVVDWKVAELPILKSLSEIIVRASGDTTRDISDDVRSSLRRYL